MAAEGVMRTTMARNVLTHAPTRFLSRTPLHRCVIRLGRCLGIWKCMGCENNTKPQYAEIDVEADETLEETEKKFRKRLEGYGAASVWKQVTMAFEQSASDRLAIRYSKQPAIS